MMENAMKNVIILASAALATLTLVACDQPRADSVPVAVSSEEVAKREAELAEIEEIIQIKDPDELYAILDKRTMHHDVGKAADAQLAKVLEDDFETATSVDELRKLQKYTNVRGSKLYRMYSARERELQK